MALNCDARCDVSVLTLILIEISSIVSHLLPEHKTLIAMGNILNVNLVSSSHNANIHVDSACDGWGWNRCPSADWSNALPT